MEFDLVKAVKGQSMEEIIKKMESDSFIGREREMALFKHCMTLNDRYIKVLHIYGTGGIGKSFLLGEFSRFAEGEGILFLMMDSGDYPHTPVGFSEQILTLLSGKLNDPGLITNDPDQKSYQYCIHLLTQLAEKRQIVIAIDTYNEMESLDRWFRQVFIRLLPPDIFVVLAGRKSLKGEWEESPAWRRVTKQIKLNNFNYLQSSFFLKKSGIEDEQNIRTLWLLTDGHPLTLSLATLTNQELDLSNPKTISVNVPQMLIDLTKIWLEEVVNEELLEIIELAALFHIFDQSSLTAILNKEIGTAEFRELVSLSFIKRLNNGWGLHDLIKEAVKVELQHRNPAHFKLLNDRLITYYYKKTIETRSAYDISQFFYHVGDEMIQSAFFQETIDISMYLEPVEAYNFHEIIAFFQDKRKHITESNAHFFDRTTGKSVLFHASKGHNIRESELIDETYIEKMGYKSIHLLKNKYGETLGISIVVPINHKTLKHLIKEPVSKTYFANLCESEFNYYNVPEQESAGLFIRMLDFNDLADTAARSYLLYNLFHHLLSGGKIVVSTPLPFFQDLLGRFGFTKVPGATHYDFGKDMPSPTYLLDVSGANLAIYLKEFMKNLSQNNRINLISETFSLTDREKDVVILILDDKTNVEIAEQLFIAEVTVKKHITRILKKANAVNRAQLIKRIMELI